MDRLLAAGAPKDVRTQWNFRDKTAGQERIVCLDEATGRPIWTRAYPCRYSVAYGSGPRATPTVAGDGSIRWGPWATCSALTKPPATSSGGRTSSATMERKCRLTDMPAPAGRWPPADRRGRRRGPCRRGLRPPDGPRVMEDRQLVGAGLLCTDHPHARRQRQLVVWHADALMGMESESGKMLWSVPHHLMAGMAISTPAVDGDRLALSSQFEGAMLLQFSRAMRPQNRRSCGKRQRPAACRRRQWKKSGSTRPSVRCCCSGNHVYGVSVLRRDLLPRRRRRTAASGPRCSRPAAALIPHDRWSTAFFVPHGDKVFIFNERGDLILARLKPSGYEEIARTHLLDPDMSASGGGAAR